MRDRAWRRKKTESKWNSRCKKFMFDSTILDGNKEYSFNMSDVNGKKSRRTIIIPNYRKPSTWKEMKEKDPWAKYLRDSSTSRSYVSDQMDAKHTNKLLRIESKKLINDGIQEWLDEFDESFECWYNEELNEWQPLYQAVQYKYYTVSLAQLAEQRIVVPWVIGSNPI